MPEPLLLTLPYGPSANTAWNVFRNRLILSKEGRQYKKLVAEALARGGVKPFSEELGVRINLYRPQRSGDIDGRLKPLLDSLNEIAWNDDSQITALDVRRRDDKFNPRVELEITPLEMQGRLTPDSDASMKYRKAGIAIVEAQQMISNGKTIEAYEKLEEARLALLYFPGVMSNGSVVANAAEARSKP